MVRIVFKVMRVVGLAAVAAALSVACGASRPAAKVPDSNKTGDLVSHQGSACAETQKGDPCTRKVESSTPAPVASAASQTSTASVGEMVRIPAGFFMMGSNDGSADEKPVHQVRVGAFEMDATEVTVAAYRVCVNAGRCSASSTVEWNAITDVQRTAFNPACNWGKPGRDNHPMNCVDWSQATAYCAYAGKRLPTEEEWEYAARGSEGRKYPWGDEEPGPDLLNACGSECVSWAKANGMRWPAMYDADDGWETTAPVGSYPRGRSPFGLHDMAANVWEWTSSGYSVDYGKNRVGDARVDRGGGWGDGRPSHVRAAGRFWDNPAGRGCNVGFRCAR